MTKEEAFRVGQVFTWADAGCNSCIADLVEQAAKQWPDLVVDFALGAFKGGGRYRFTGSGIEIESLGIVVLSDGTTEPIA